MKTLVCVIGTIRGGETAWNSLLQRVCGPLDADLALFVSRMSEKTILHEKAKFDWSFDDPVDWGDELNRICSECGIQKNCWHACARRTCYESLWGGVLLDGKVLKGSGALIMILRDMLLSKLPILQRYEKIIITRSDHLYFYDHPPLSPGDEIEVPVGEDWWGITDRHHVVPVSKIETYLCIAKWWMQNIEMVENSMPRHHNPEQLLAMYFKDMSFDIKRTKRTMASVSLRHDSTRWKVGIVKVPGYDDLFFKYPHEYYSHIKQRVHKRILGNRVKYINNFGNIHH
tara:strand:+ start:2717 stop:3574 length:858 start_codon:yes stop_codon:yes gene_type:complete